MSDQPTTPETRGTGHQTDAETAVPPPKPPASARNGYVRVLTWLPVLGYAVMIPYVAILSAVLGPNAHPLVIVGVPELLLGAGYVACLYGDRRALAADVPLATRGVLWYPAAFVLGGTVLLAPLVVAAYLRRRRASVGHPQRGWLSAVRAGGLGNADN